MVNTWDELLLHSNSNEHVLLSFSVAKPKRGDLSGKAFALNFVDSGFSRTALYRLFKQIRGVS